MTRIKLILVILVGLIGLAVLVTFVASSASPTPATLQHPTPRPTFPFPTGTAVPVTSAESVLIETEPGPLFVMMSTVDEHGLKGSALISVMSAPDPTDTTTVGDMLSGTFAQVLEIRRLPPDYLRSFYLITAQGRTGTVTGWVPDFLAHRTVFVIAFDSQGCACAMPVPLWADATLSQQGSTVTNRSPLRLLAVGDTAVQVQVLSDGSQGWLDRKIVHESQENEFLKYIQP